jgi:hypothetical protein
LLDYISAKFDQFRASNDFNTQSSSFPVAPSLSSFPVAPSSSAIHDDPFQTVDPFASQSDLGSPTTLTNNDWYQPSTNGPTNDPFVSKTKKNAPVITTKQTPAVDPWGGSTSTTNGNSWAPFTSSTNGNSSTGTVQYRALYDYAPERADEMAMSVGDIITVSRLVDLY